MYHLEVYDELRKKSTTISFPTYEQILEYEKTISQNEEWKKYSHFGEISGTDEHADWYALKQAGVWVLYNRKWNEE